MKVAIYHTCAPFAKDGGAPLLRGLVPNSRISDVLWCYASNREAEKSGQFRCLPALIPEVGERLPRPIRSGAFRAGLWGLVEKMDFPRCIDEASSRLADILQREKPDVIWGTAHLALIPILERVTRDFSGHIHVSVHDDPTHLLTKGGSYWPHKPAEIVEATYPRLLRRANSIDAVSPGMAEYIQGKYGVSSSIMPPAPRIPITLGTPPENPQETFRVFATGSWDCEDSFAALCDGLMAAERTGVISSPRILFVNYNKKTIRPQHAHLVDFIDHLPEDEATQLAQTCHLLYAPYSFTAEAEQFQRTSMSGKLSMYLPACRPILFHGPGSTSLDRFHRDTGIGTSWTSTAPSELIPHLRTSIELLEDLGGLVSQTTAVVDRFMNRSAQQEELWAQFDKKAMSAAQVA